jgi:hypothetical protein
MTAKITARKSVPESNRQSFIFRCPAINVDSSVLKYAATASLNSICNL